MNQNLSPYDAYSPSPVPWLADVPSDWDAIRLDRLFRYRSEEPLDSDGRVTGYLDGRVTLRSNVAGQKIKGVVYETGWQRIHVGDFAISGMNAHLGGMGVSDSEGKCSPIYMVLEPLPDTNAHFVSLAVRHAAHLGAIKALVQTIRFNSADMKRADLKKIFVPVPSMTEQEQIVRFVRQLDSRVNRLIKAKRRLIELMNEQKQAIIHQAVTRGLDPTVPLKPSGIDWLGKVPVHWNVRRVKTLLEDVRKTTNALAEGDRYVALENVEGWSGHIFNLMEEPVFDSQVKRFKSGDILFGKLRPYLAKVASPDFDGVCVGEFLVLRVRSSGICGRFLEHRLRSKDTIAEINGSTFGAKMPRADWSFIGSMFLAIPPSVDEQEAICTRIAESTGELDAVIGKTRTEIDLIREFRTRLVADVVTGQLDVRQHPWANTEIEDSTEPILDDAELEDDLGETDDVLEEAGV